MSSRSSRRIVRLLVAGAAALLLVGCGDDGGEGTTPTTSPTPTSSASPTQAAQTSGVYFVVDTRTGFRLARELRDLSGDPAASAVETMIAGAEDPDYATTWDPGTQVLGVTTDGSAIEVDLSPEARTANVGSAGAALMIQQLVYTVTEAVDDPEATVQLLIEGEPAGELWGAVSWAEPVGRADPLDVRSLVQIDSPREGASTSSPLRIEGEAAVFEATLAWRVLDAKGAEVQAGFTMTAEGQTFAPFAFPVELEPGTYTVEISEDDASGGEGGAPMTDTRSVTIE